MKLRYLTENRLADVLAAIQVMGSSTWDSRPIKDWKLFLYDKPQSADSWESLFAEHPEFFGSREHRSGQRHYFLLLRRAYPKTIEPDTGFEISNEQLEKLRVSGDYRDARLARRALTPEQVVALMNAAVELEIRAAALEDRARWWIPLAAAVLAFTGAILGSMLKVIIEWLS
jgi:hypothetical protein